MTVEVERTFEVDATREEVWALLANEESRAEAISIVEGFERDGEETVWNVRLPGPLAEKTMAVRTRDVQREPPRFVKFVGRSSAMDVTGEHELTETETGCRVRNRFVVEGTVPGVEYLFERSIDEEVENIMAMVPATVRPA
jgi:carbon monoxide dehydrogenase subunit G